jgi:hypothetical protein
VAASTASSAACTAITVCVITSSRRFGMRSASTPPNSDSARIGVNCTVLTMPSASGESVSLSTSHAWPMRCIQVPTRETSWPNQKSR